MAALKLKLSVIKKQVHLDVNYSSIKRKKKERKNSSKKTNALGYSPIPGTAGTERAESLQLWRISERLVTPPMTQAGFFTSPMLHSLFLAEPNWHEISYSC